MGVVRLVLQRRSLQVVEQAQRMVLVMVLLMMPPQPKTHRGTFPWYCRCAVPVLQV